MPWIARSFNFDIPIDLFPYVLVRYGGTPARVEDMIQNHNNTEVLNRNMETVCQRSFEKF